jgi:hypothetical protein
MTPRFRWWALVAALAGVLVTACSGPARPAHHLDARGGTVSGLGGAVRVTAPKGTASDANLSFHRLQEFPRSAYNLLPGAVQLTPPVTINVDQGSLARDRAYVTLKLPAGPPRRAVQASYIADTGQRRVRCG